MTSLWLADRITTSPASDTAADFSDRADVVVAGAGITGLVTAVLLARAGREVLVLEATDLYYRPIWAFEFHWQPKDRRGVLEVDAVTGQVRTTASLMHGIDLGKVISRDGLFDIGADTIGMVIPGANIAVKLAKVVLDATKHDTPRQP